MPNVTQGFANYLFGKSGQITASLRGRADACRQDYLAVTAAGAAKNKRRWETLLARTSSGPAELIGSQRPILLLDEATSSLDGATEVQLLKNLRAMTDRTVIIVTHRPAVLDYVDEEVRFG